MTSRELKLFLRKYRILQQDFAKYVGVSGVYISNIMQGKYPVPKRVEEYIQKATPILERMEKIRKSLYVKNE